MTPTLKTFVLNKMRAYLCSKMFLCAIENALGLLVSCLKNRPIFYENIGAYTDGLLLKNIFIGLYIRLSADACKGGIYEVVEILMLICALYLTN